MKTLKKIVSLSVVMTMIITTMLTNCAFAAIQFNDVDETTSYSKAIYNLVEDGVLNGYDNEDGSKSFRPEADITRAEFAKVIVVAKYGANVIAEATASKFSDMEGNWAVPYVEYASGAGIINGYEDGTFRPANPVTYAEAVKMVVCALGYGPVVEVTSPWYQGYLNIANIIGLTKGAVGMAEVPAVRGLVAQLVDNMGDCKNLVQDGVNADGTPNWTTDSNDNIIGPETYEDQGVLIGIYDNSLKGVDTQLNMSRVNINEKIYELDSSINYLDLEDYLGQAVRYKWYAKSGTNYITSIKSANATTITTIDATLIDSFDGSKLYFYENEDAYNTKYYSLDKNIYVVYNGYGVEKANISAGNLTTWLNIDTGKVTLYNNDSDKDIDVIYIEKYDTYFAQAPVTSNGITTIKDQITPTKTISLDEDDVIVTKVSSAGGAETSSTLRSIYRDNIISVAAPLNANGKTIVKISSATASGAISTMGSDYEDVMIGSKEYKFTKYFRNLVASNSAKYGFDMGDNVCFYLDFTGRVVYCEIKASEIPYGYLIDYIESTDMMNKGITIRLIDATNNLIEAEIKSNIKINGTTVDESDVVDNYLAPSAARIEAAKDSEYKAPQPGGGRKVISQLIKYKTGTENGKTVIEELYTISSTATSQETEDGGIVPAWTMLEPDVSGNPSAFVSGSAKYKVTGTSAKSFQVNDVTQFNVSNDTIVFKIPKGRADVNEFRRTKGTSNFSAGSSYVVEAYDVESKRAGVVVYYTTATSTGATIGGNTPSYLVISCIPALNEAGKSVHMLEYVKLGDSVLDAEGNPNKLSIYSKDSNQLAGIKRGDVIRFVKSSNELDVVEKLFVYADKKVYNDGATAATDNYSTEKYSGKEKWFQAQFGKVSVMHLDKNGVGYISVFKGETQVDELYNITADTKYYTLDNSGYVVDSGYGMIVDADSSDYESATEILVVSYEDKVTAVYIMPVPEQTN